MEALKPLTKFAAEWGTSTQVAAGVQGSVRQPDQRKEAQPDQQQQQHSGAADGQQEQAVQQEWHSAELAHAQALLCNLLVLPSSRPLHKQLLSGLRPLLEQQQRWLDAGQVRKEETFAGIAAARIAELAGAYLAAAGSGGSGSCADRGAVAGDAAAGTPAGPGTDALALGSALAALLANGACKPALADCAVPAVAALARGIRAVLGPATADGGAGGPGAAAATAVQAVTARAEAAAEDGQGLPEGASYLTTTVMEGLQDCSERCLLACAAQSPACHRRACGVPPARQAASGSLFPCPFSGVAGGAAE